MPGNIKQILINTLTLNFWYLKIIHILHPLHHPKIIEHIPKNKLKNKCVCIDEIIRFIIMKMNVKMKKRSHRCDRNRPRSRHGHKYSKYKVFQYDDAFMYQATTKQQLKFNS